MQEGLDQTINERVGNDLHVNTHEERKGGELIDVSKLSIHDCFCISTLYSVELQINLLLSSEKENNLV